MSLVNFIGNAYIGQSGSAEYGTGYVDARDANPTMSTTNKRDIHPHAVFGTETRAIVLNMPFGTTVAYMGCAILGPNLTSLTGLRDIMGFVNIRDSSNSNNSQNLVLQWSRKTGRAQLQTAISLNGHETVGSLPRIWLNRGWHYFELYAFIDSSGAYELRIDGATVASGSHDLAQWTSSIDRAFVGSHSFAGITDFYCCDAVGTRNNSFLGPRTVHGILPVEDGSLTQFTPSATGDNYVLVDESTAPSSSDYVYTTSDGVVDMYRFGGPGQITDINGIRVFAHATNSGAGSAKVQLRASRSGSTSTGLEEFVGQQVYGYYSKVFESDPNTNAQWLSGNITTSEFGYEGIIP